MPPAYVKPYVKRQKNDTTDAEAICEAVTRPSMQFVPTKTVEQQSCLLLHRARHLFIRQQTAVINSIRAYLAEFGIVAPVGRRGVEQLLEVVADTDDRRLPETARACLAALGSQLRALKLRILELDRRIIAWHRSNATSKRLDAIPGVGPALVASIADPRAFRSGRDFSAWVGLVPKQNSSGGKDKLGSLCRPPDYAERVRYGASLSRWHRRSRARQPHSIRHSLVVQSASRKASRRSFGRKRVRLPRSYGLSFARAASLRARWACRYVCVVSTDS
jgi:transposase